MAKCKDIIRTNNHEDHDRNEQEEKEETRDRKIWKTTARTEDNKEDSNDDEEHNNDDDKGAWLTVANLSHTTAERSLPSEHIGMTTKYIFF